MKAYIKKVNLDCACVFEVWDNDTLIESCVSIVRANKILKGLL